MLKITVAAVFLFSLSFAGCRKKPSAEETGKERECRDFAAEVASAFQQTMNLKDNQSGDFQAQMKAASKELRDELKKACLSGELGAEVISCVQKSRMEAFATMQKCIPEDYLPVLEESEDY